MRRWLHDRLRRHYRFEQGTTEFYLCVPRWRWQRGTEYGVMMAGLPPIAVPEDVFVNLDRRLHGVNFVSLDDAAAQFGVDLDDGDTEEDPP